jgi:hypothetical protein
VQIALRDFVGVDQHSIGFLVELRVGFDEAPLVEPEEALQHLPGGHLRQTRQPNRFFFVQFGVDPVNGEVQLGDETHSFRHIFSHFESIRFLQIIDDRFGHRIGRLRELRRSVQNVFNDGLALYKAFLAPIVLLYDDTYERCRF